MTRMSLVDCAQGRVVPACHPPGPVEAKGLAGGPA